MKSLKVILAVMLFSVTFSFANVGDANASSNITIYVNNEKQSYSNKAVLKGGSTLVPLRGIFEVLGAEVKWDQTSKTIDATKGTTKIWLKIGSKATKVNGKTVNIDVPAQVVNGSTLVPLRFIGEALGAEVKWNQSSKTINITAPKEVTGEVPSKPNTKKPMKVHFIDVGQGDSTFIQMPNGKTALIDAGTDAAGEKVVAYLKSLGIKTIDYVIATHPDADHIGGMVDVLNAFTISNFIDSGKVHTSKTYENMLLTIQNKNIKYIVPEEEDILSEDAETYLQILNANPNADDNNDASLVVAAGYCTNDVLLMADAGVEVESEMIQEYEEIQAEILKAGHHGSNTSSSLSFLKAVDPEAVILSYGASNSYGHPHKEVMSNIKSVGAKAYSTAQDGTIIATINCGDYSIAKEFKYEVDKTPPTTKPEEKPESLFKNCTELKAVYPSGVPVGHAAYELKHDGDNDGWACESETVTPIPDPEPVLPVTPTPPPVTTPPVKTYKNCSELKVDYPDGVKRGHPAYQSKMDGDGDGHACE
ncbi:hypothetical protein CSE16_11805 [Solibacillus sp. R5-41]|uniref:stalk domain-containing protein n=1 Tax=Solibacillus sp. R5-41 TaxID=2048654 RepID=UPI000C126CAC|nr:stalk domain-containing protein [Solibacillus sp. R5-41]ATP40676.1 hypothetical protein CSE16_11805 [Solibacillus sp. R5-41]